jgi:addiction module HigA family antidote
MNAINDLMPIAVGGYQRVLGVGELPFACYDDRHASTPRTCFWASVSASNTCRHDRGGTFMDPISHPGRLLKRELEARRLSANRLALNLGVPSGRITDILNGRRSITADTALRLGRYFGNSPRFWLDLQSQHDLATLERERGLEISRQVHPAEAAI